MGTKAVDPSAKAEYKPSVSIDIDPDDLKDVSIGDTVDVKLKGKVVSMNQCEPDDFNQTGATLRMELIGTPTMTSGDNEFESMAEEEND